MDYVDEELDNL